MSSDTIEVHRTGLIIVGNSIKVDSKPLQSIDFSLSRELIQKTISLCTLSLLQILQCFDPGKRYDLLNTSVGLMPPTFGSVAGMQLTAFGTGTNVIHTRTKQVSLQNLTSDEFPELLTKQLIISVKDQNNL